MQTTRDRSSRRRLQSGSTVSGPRTPSHRTLGEPIIGRIGESIIRNEVIRSEHEIFQTMSNEIAVVRDDRFARFACRGVKNIALMWSRRRR